jgi:DNA polymerase-1
MSKPTLILVDGSGYIFRGYYGIRPMHAPDGTPVNAVFGFASMMMALLRDHQPEHITVAFDRPGKGWRHDIYPEYKANRPPAPEDLVPQFSLIREVVDAFAISRMEEDGWEADDLIAAAATDALAQGFEVVMVSGDKDMMQLIRPGVRMFDPMKKIWVDEAVVADKFGCVPGKVIEVQAMAGDSTDNIPGIPGIGVKTAALLLAEYGDMEAVLAAAHAVDEKGKPLIRQNKRRERLQEHADLARISLQLVTLRDDAPFELTPAQWRWSRLDAPAVHALFDRLGFRRLQHHPVLTSAQRQAVQTEAAQSSALDRSKYRCITDSQALLQVCDAIRTAGAFAWDTETTGLDPATADLVGISLAWGPGEAVYVPVGHVDEAGALRPGQISFVAVKSLLGRLLNDERLARFAQNWTFDARVLMTHGWEILPPTGDPMLAAYLLDSVDRNYGLDALARKHLDHVMIPFADALGDLEHFGCVDLEAATRYAAEDADATLRLAIGLGEALEAADLNRVYRTMELPLCRVLVRMEALGISLDAKHLIELSVELTARIAALEVEAHALAEEPFNLGSPKQVAEVLFERMGLPAGKKTKSGYSTDASVLQKLADDGHELPAVLLRWRHDAKLRNTYAEVLPKLIASDGRIHTRYLQVRTATGRLASTDPNLQNIPIRTADGRRVREAFVAAPGHRLISADYSQVELRVLAHMSEDPILVEAFLAGDDIHRRTAAEIFDVPPLLVSPEQRRQAKAINFGIVYGMGAFRLATELGISRAEANTYLDRFHARYAGVRTFHESCVQAAHSDGYATTIFGRRRPIPELRASSKRDVAQGERVAINTPVQGSAADILKLAMVQLDAALTEQFPASRLLLTVHDELVLEAPEAEASAVATLTKKVMEGAARLRVPLVVDVGTGVHWGQAH